MVRYERQQGACTQLVAAWAGMKFLGSMGDAFTSGKANSYGQVTLLPEEIEDLWHTYNLIAKGDKLLATTFRKVQKQSSTGSVDSQKVKMSLAISVSRIDFDPEGGSLRVGGTIASEHEGLHLGAHHTIELELQRKYTLAKAAWDSLYLERVTQATQGAASTADVAALLMQQGLANLCLVSGGMPTPRTLSLSLSPSRSLSLSLSLSPSPSLSPSLSLSLSLSLTLTLTLSLSLSLTLTLTLTLTRSTTARCRPRSRAPSWRAGCR